MENVQISNGAPPIEQIVVGDEKYIFGDRYMVWPVQESDIGNDQYRAMLTLNTVEMTDGGNETTYSLLIHQMDQAGVVIDSAEHR